MRIRGTKHRKGESGSSLVEFAIVAFMLVIVLLSVVEMGRMILVYTAVSQAARAGTRYAIVHGSDQTASAVGPGNPCTCTSVQNYVKANAAAGLVNTSLLTVTVNYPDSANTIGSRVSVTVTYPYDPLVGYFSSILNKTLGSTSTGVIVF